MTAVMTYYVSQAPSTFLSSGESNVHYVVGRSVIFVPTRTDGPPVGFLSFSLNEMTPFKSNAQNKRISFLLLPFALFIVLPTQPPPSPRRRRVHFTERKQRRELIQSLAEFVLLLPFFLCNLFFVISNLHPWLFE